MIPVNSGVILLNPNIITKSRKLTLISYYQRIHTSHSGSSKCPNMCFMQNTPVRDHVFYFAFRSFSFSMEYFFSLFLTFKALTLLNITDQLLFCIMLQILFFLNFLMFRFRSCIFGRDIREIMLLFSLHPIRL